MNGSSPPRRMIAALLAIAIGRCSCRSAPIAETPSVTLSPTATISAPAPGSGTRLGCGQRLRTATPSPPACTSHAAVQTLGTEGEPAFEIVQVNQNLGRAPGSDPAVSIVWDAALARGLREIVASSPAAISAAFAPDGNLLAVGTLDGAVDLWDVAAGERLRTLQGHAGPVYSVAFAPDGATLASGSVDGTAVVWDAATGQAQRTLGGHNSWITSLAFSPDGSTLAAGTSEHAVVLWDVHEGTRRRSLDLPHKHVSHVVFSPGGGVLVTSSGDGRVTLWDPAAGARELEIYAQYVGSLAFSPDGTMLAVARPGRVLLLDLATHKQIHELVGHDRILYDRVVFADDRTVAAGTADGRGALWQITPTGAYCHVWLQVYPPGIETPPPPPASPLPVTQVGPTRTPGPSTVLGDGPDARDFGSLAYVTSAGDETIWLLSGDGAPRQLAAGTTPRLSPDGCSLLYLQTTSGSSYPVEYAMLDVPTAAVRFVLSHDNLWHSSVYGLAWSPDSKHLALTTGGDIKRLYSGDLWLVDASDGSTTQITESGGGEPVYSPDGRWIATSTPEIGWSHGSVGLWHADGQGRSLFSNPIWSCAQSWATDSSGFSLAVTQHEGVGNELWWVPVDGEAVQIGHLPEAHYVSWQPGGGRLVYYEPDPVYEYSAQLISRSAHSLHLANCDGSEDVVVPGPEGMSPGSPWATGRLGASPWSPDGRWLLTQDGEAKTYIVDTDRLGEPFKLNVERIHGWLDDTHYLASVFSAGSTTLYRCTLPETCWVVAQIGGEIAQLDYTHQRCDS